jgi:class 3 adenylate cyclase/tetratricopeptide (TPR) repeat protein
MGTWACEACGGENPDGMRFCGHCGAPATRPDEPGEHREAEVAEALRSFVAGAVGDRLVETGGRLPEERRLVTAVFADVSGFTSLAERLDPEQLLEVIDPVIAALSSVVARYEGYVEKFAGDALLALFGAPVSHEDDAERALLVALEMHAELERICAALPYEAELTLHVGVNSGHGIARILGSEARMDYAVLGDSIILAQRLESAAPPGETYVSEDTYRLTRQRFGFEAVGELTLKGKSEPVPAWRLVGELPRVERARRRLVGRERELAIIAATIGALGGGRGSVVAVTGEPGVGKTRLTEEARELARQRGIRWLEARCISYGAALAYWPYVDLFRREPEIVEAADAEGRPFLAHLLGETAAEIARLEPEAFRRGLHAAVVTAFRRLAPEPAVLLLEDVHWADPSSIALTGEIARLCDEAPLLVYLVGRPEARSLLHELAPDLHAVELAPFDEAGVDALMHGVLAGPPPAGLSAFVAERSGGNPLFVEELVQSLLETGALEQAEGTWRIRPGWDARALPTTLEKLLAARIDLLPRATTEVLQMAAVIGRRLRLALLRGVAGGRDVAGAVEQLVERGFLERRADGEEEEALLFRHALIQDAAYERLLRRQRRELHRRVAETAEALYGAGDDTIDLLARHLYLGEAGEKAVAYLRRAGARAKRLFANEEAILHFGRAAELAPEDSDLRLELADLHELVGNYEEALSLYRQATDDVRGWSGIASTLRKLGNYSEALAVVDEAFASGSVADADLPLLWLEKGATLSSEGHFGEAIEALKAGVSAATEGRDAPAQLLVPLARAELVAGRMNDALRHAREASARFEQDGDLRSASSAARLLGDIYTSLGHHAEAVQTLERGLELAERVGNVEEIGGCLINLGNAKLAQGEFDDAVRCNERAIAEFERIGHGSGRAIAYSNLAWVLAKKGDYDGAERYCERAIELSRSIGHLLVAAETTDTMAFIRLSRGFPEDAVVRAEEAADLFLELGSFPKAAQSLELAATAWERLGDEVRAAEARARARTLVTYPKPTLPPLEPTEISRQP